MELTKAQILKWLEVEENEFQVEAFRRKHDIDPGSSTLFMTLSRLVEEGSLKRKGRGWYCKIESVKPIFWWTIKHEEPLPVKFPRGIEDDSNFGFDGSIEVFSGDTIVLAGTSNMGKTCFALNFLVDNIDLCKGTRLMVNEYKPVRFKNRMAKFTWGNIWNDDKPKFELIPVIKNHEDYIKPDYLNIIDWILLRGEFWVIAGIIEDMQMKLREGLLLVVLQKTKGKEFGMGGEWGQLLPAAYFNIDPPGKLTVMKVKSQKLGTRNLEGKVFAFDIEGGGSKFEGIREVKNCPKCKGLYGNKWCVTCKGKGYIEILDTQDN